MKEDHIIMLRVILCLICIFICLNNHLPATDVVPATTSSGLTSVTDRNPYRDFCVSAVNDPNVFKNFKKSPIIIGVMQHVTKNDGVAFTSYISENYPHFISKMKMFRENDRLGNPKTFKYKQFGRVSPTNLRYIKIAGDIESQFGNLDGCKVIEIGGGYGGQCKILSDLFDLEQYTIVDLPEALALAKKYLDTLNVKNVRFLTPEEVKIEEYDLVISNYAFSECNRSIQNNYLEKILTHSHHGYMICNVINACEPENFRQAELVGILEKQYNHDPSILPEEPGTHPKNYLLIWHQKNINSQKEMTISNALEMIQ